MCAISEADLVSIIGVAGFVFIIDDEAERAERFVGGRRCPIRPEKNICIPFATVY
jgi:hypothetical protein